MKNRVVKNSKKSNAYGITKRTLMACILLGMGVTTTQAIRKYTPSGDQSQSASDNMHAKIEVDSDKIKALCDFLGHLSHDIIKQYDELKRLNEALRTMLNHNPYKDIILKEDMIDAIALKSVIERQTQSYLNYMNCLLHVRNLRVKKHKVSLTT